MGASKRAARGQAGMATVAKMGMAAVDDQHLLCMAGIAVAIVCAKQAPDLWEDITNGTVTNPVDDDAKRWIPILRTIMDRED